MLGCMLCLPTLRPLSHATQNLSHLHFSFGAPFTFFTFTFLRSPFSLSLFHFHHASLGSTCDSKLEPLLGFGLTPWLQVPPYSLPRAHIYFSPGEQTITPSKPGAMRRCTCEWIFLEVMTFHRRGKRLQRWGDHSEIAPACHRGHPRVPRRRILVLSASFLFLPFLPPLSFSSSIL